MTDTDDTPERETASEGAQTKPDWARIATDALDLWQSHLTSLANDPKAKEEMARFVAPMGQMFTQWTSMMQQGMQTVATATAQAAAAAQEAAAHAQAEAAQAAAGPTGPEAEPAEPETDAGQNAAAETETMGEDAQTDADTPAADRPATLEGTDDAAPPAQAAPAGARGRAASSDSARDLAQLAGRLAELERELDGLRARPRRSRESGADSDPADGRDAADAGAVQQVAGTHPGKTSP